MAKTRPAILIAIIALLCTLTLTLTGCAMATLAGSGGSSGNGSGSSSGTSSGTSTPQTPSTGGSTGSSGTSGSSTYDSFQRVGEDGVGYVTIPSDWYPFVDVDNPTASQWCADPYTIITMVSYPEYKGQLTAYDAASNLYASLTGDSEYEDVEGAQVSLNGLDAYQVYGWHPSDQCYLVMWTVEDLDGIVHYVSAEGPADVIYEVVSMVENTYSFYE